MILALDQFVFGMETLPWQELQRSTQWKHRSNSRIGVRDARQYLGPGDDLVTITGVLIPEITGDRLSLDELRKMADAGEAYVLIDASGVMYGAFVIEALDETQSLIDSQGNPRRIDFRVGLTRVELEAMLDPALAAQIETTQPGAKRDRPTVQAEFDQVKAAWSAELAKTDVLDQEALQYAKEGNQAAGQAKLDESKRIRAVAKAKYERRYDALKAELNSMPA
jgi:phage protein U